MRRGKRRPPTVAFMFKPLRSPTFVDVSSEWNDVADVVAYR